MNTRNVYDRAAVFHFQKGLLGKVECAEQIYVQHLYPVVCFKLSDRFKHHQTSVIYDDIQPAETFDRGIDGPFDRLLVRNVTLTRESLSFSAITQFFGRC